MIGKIFSHELSLLWTRASHVAVLEKCHHQSQKLGSSGLQITQYLLVLLVLILESRHSIGQSKI